MKHNSSKLQNAFSVSHTQLAIERSQLICKKKIEKRNNERTNERKKKQKRNNELTNERKKEETEGRNMALKKHLELNGRPGYRTENGRNKRIPTNE
jgi:hypothetical protein